ncbi:hypothetical protein X777_04368 [Ooceraea biroi]|uniref:Uncharacterized protein n=1 Tax=Ooceraea biroi TaxID=2015173 RepID=A0A026WH67_OOCBI|nr:hypothetical protein X777_04368 [Ooceraea biroi]
MQIMPPGTIKKKIKIIERVIICTLDNPSPLSICLRFGEFERGPVQEQNSAELQS